MRSKRSWWLLVAVTALVAVLAPLPVGAAELELDPDPHLAAIAEETGSVEVIVELDGIFRQTSVLAALAGSEYRELAQYEYMPLMALEVSSEALRRASESAPSGVGFQNAKYLRPRGEPSSDKTSTSSSIRRETNSPGLAMVALADRNNGSPP